MRALCPSMPTIAALAMGVLAAGGCGDGDDVCTTTSALSSDASAAEGGEGGGDGTAGMAASADDASTNNGQPNETDGSPQTLAEVRFANWLAEAPSVDFCIAPHGTTAFEGPMLAGLAAQIDAKGVLDAGAAALSFPQASAYIPVAPQQYDARLVAAGATGCSAGIGADATYLPELTPGTFETIALMGELDATDGAPGVLTLVGFLDAAVASEVDVRFINAVPDSGLVNFGAGASASAFAPIFANVAFEQAGTISDEALDAAAPPTQTYAEYSPPHGEGAFSVVNADNVTDVEVTATNITLTAGAVATFILVGPVPNASPANELVICVDNGGTVGLVGDCTVVSN